MAEKSRLVSKKTVDIVTSRNIWEWWQKNYEIFQNNEKTSPTRKKEVGPIALDQMNIYQSNTYRKDLSRLHFDEEPTVHERQQEKGQQ